MNYKLPEVEKLKNLGFKTEFYPMHEFFEYAKKFVEDNDDDLFKILLPDFNIEKYNETFELNSCPYYDVIKAEERIERLEKGIIEKDDYRFVMHPAYKNDGRILRRAWIKRKHKYGLDSNALLYFPRVFGCEPLDSIHETLLNELYIYIIKNIPIDLFDKPDNAFKQYYDQIDFVRDKLDPSNLEVESIRYKFRISRIKRQVDIIKNEMYEDIFSKSLSRKDRASFLFHRIHNHPGHFIYMNQTTSFGDKELVIRQYLKAQSKVIQNLRNSRGNGSHENKKNIIIQYFKTHPASNISSAARALKLDRKTVRKHKP